VKTVHITLLRAISYNKVISGWPDLNRRPRAPKARALSQAAPHPAGKLSKPDVNRTANPPE
jgi:hypothetical protein